MRAASQDVDLGHVAGSDSQDPCLTNDLMVAESDGGETLGSGGVQDEICFQITGFGSSHCF